jgi:hypothetical protein
VDGKQRFVAAALGLAIIPSLPAERRQRGEPPPAGVQEAAAELAGQVGRSGG